MGSRLRLSERLLNKSKEIYQKIVELNNKFSFLETSSNFYYNASKSTLDILEIGEFNSRQFIDAALELVPEPSSPPTNCLYHGDIPNNSDEVTDITIANAGADIQFGSGNFATLAITDVNTFNFDPMYHPDINP
ncbi:MAG TPA: hypothetical protein VFS97_01260 [Nitrososphaeraceae archaeon]|nr:hypothetical protein [Nitrososphaeraceae archaeon]